jgi:hypothetical protein
MATKKQIKANRANASHSSGPVTAAGWAASSQNSLKHGLASYQLIIPGESEEEFNTLLTGLLTEHQPSTLTETLLVQDMAKYHWLTDRALRLQSDTMGRTVIPIHENAALLALFIRYQTANERAFQRAFASLNTLRKTRLAEIGSASKSTAQAANQAAKTEAAAAKLASDASEAAFLRSISAPSEEEMNASGYFKNDNGVYQYETAT